MKEEMLFEVSLIGGAHNTFNVLAKSYSEVEEYFSKESIFQITKRIDFGSECWVVDLSQDGKLINTDKKTEE